MQAPSLRRRLPLEISAVVLVTGLGIAGVMLWFQFLSLQADMQDSTERLTRVLAHAITPELALGDRWAIYNTIKVVYTGAEPGWLLPAFILVLNPDGKTVAASDPVRFHTGDAPDALGADLARIRALGAPDDAGMTAPLSGEQGRYWWRRLYAGDAAVGTLVLGFAHGAIWPQFYRSARRLLATIAIAVVALLPVAWWLGRRMARPLEVLDDCVARLSGDSPLPVACQAAVPYSELSQLRDRVEQVAIELQDRQRLERQVVRAEKQAMLGRLAAGVAHEINNPLGGMQAAIGMYKRHGGNPEVVRQTLSLLERGLDQIRHIVSALLIEVKPEQRPFTPQDVDDIAELVAPMLRERELGLQIDNRLEHTVAVAAGPVRQILLNLALNAVQAAPAGEQVQLRVSQDDTVLQIKVGNGGPEIPAERLVRLFEPFDTRDGDESSLGLWLTHLTVAQLDGRVDAVSADGRTEFTVRLPLGEST